MKVYIASFFADKTRIAERARELNHLGIECTMRWPYETAPHNATINDFPEEYFRETAVIDIEDIIAADKLILTVPTQEQLSTLTIEAASRGGRHFESGFMYGLIYQGDSYSNAKELILLGPRENVFHFLDGQSVTSKYPAIRQFDTWEQVKEYLKEAK